MARVQFDFEYQLKELRQIFEQRRDKMLMQTSPALSESHQALLDKFKQAETIEEAEDASHGLPIEVTMCLSLDGLKEKARHPYHYSSLRDWLGLETWHAREALLLLVGVCPRGAIVEWETENFMGAVLDEPRIVNATCLNEIGDDYIVPSIDAWDDDIREAKRELRERGDSLGEEEKAKLQAHLEHLQRLKSDPSVVTRSRELALRSRLLGELSRHWFSGDHDPQKRYSPEHYLGWASARGFVPEWHDWARSQGLIDAHEAVFRQPFFDPDSPDYPELLHIAVNAWQEARKGGLGTPKQRIERFLQVRYAALPPTTRELIAQLANWQRTGGRPRG